jgi:hypothetical protein
MPSLFPIGGGGGGSTGYASLTIVDVTDGSSSPYEISTTQINNIFTNSGATEEVYIVLPSASAGLYFKFSVLDANGMRVIANTGDIINLFGQSTEVEGGIYSTDIYSGITLYAVDDTNWVAIDGGSGIWQIGEGQMAGITKLATVTGIDLQVTTKQSLYTVPTGKICVSTLLLVRNASTTPDDIVFSFGFNGSANDLGSIQDLQTLTSALRCIQPSATGSLSAALQQPRALGAAADVLGCIMASANSVPCTVDIDVFGYLIDA